MSQSTNQKYNDLLNKFLQNDNLMEKNESKELERWLFEAENNIRSQSQSHQGNLLTNSHHTYDDEELVNNRDCLEAAMRVSLSSNSSDDDHIVKHEQVKKRSHSSSFMSEMASPLAKRLAVDQSFLTDVLDINMISLSCGSSPSLSVGGNSDSILESPNGTSGISKIMSEDTLVILKESAEPLNQSYINMNKDLIQPQPVATVNVNNSSCIWPIRISYQADFVEIVITDEEMNVYWDTLKDF